MRLIHSAPVLALALCVAASPAARAQEEPVAADDPTATAAGATPAAEATTTADPAAGGAAAPPTTISGPTGASPTAVDPAGADAAEIDPAARQMPELPAETAAPDPASAATGTTGTTDTVATPGALAGGSASGFSCRASAARVTLTGQTAQEPAVANQSGGECVADLPELVADLSLGELGSVSLLGAKTAVGGDSAAEAGARVASVVLTPATGTVIQLDVLTASASGRCSGGNAELSGEARVLSMQTNGEAPVAVPDQDDLVVFEEGGAILTLHRTTSAESSRTVQAAVLETAQGEVVIGEAVIEAGADACAGVPDSGASGGDETPGSGGGPTSSTAPGFGLNVDLGGQGGHNRLLPGLDSLAPTGSGSSPLGNRTQTSGLPLASAGLPLGKDGGSSSSIGGLPALGGGVPALGGTSLGGGDATEQDDSRLGGLLDFLSGDD